MKKSGEVYYHYEGDDNIIRGIFRHMTGGPYMTVWDNEFELITVLGVAHGWEITVDEK